MFDEPIGMTPLLIHYFKVPVGFCLLDTPVFEAVNHLPWRLEVPRFVQDQRHTTDVLLALLREDENILRKCTVYLMMNASHGFRARLNKVVMHLDLVPLLTQFMIRNNPQKEILFAEIRSRLMACPRVIHLDRNNLNMQYNNLRELSYEPLEEPSGLFHESD